MKQEPNIATCYKTISTMGKEAMRRKRAAGEHLNRALVGSKNARDAMGKSVFVLDPTSIGLVDEARILRAKGNSVRAVCKIMEEKGLRYLTYENMANNSAAQLSKFQAGRVSASTSGSPLETRR